MSANTSIEILRVLLQEECLTAKQISEHLHCSRRTVLNYINQVKDLAQKEHLHLIISKGKSNIFMWNTITLGILQLIAMLILSPYGLKNMLTVYVAINIGWLFVWHYFVSREIKLSLWAALKDVVPYAGIALLAIAAAYFITGHITDIYLLILTKITVTAILYGGLMWICGSETFKESLSYLLKKTRKK